MGLDIYAGTLTRYYAQNWKTVTQQWAEENGYSFNRITPGGDGGCEGDEEAMSPAEIQECMERWRDNIVGDISRIRQGSCASWQEDNEKPYFTQKPDWDAFGAMLLVAACSVYGEPVPAVIPKNFRFTEHPLIVRLAQDEERVWSLVRDTDWWLPLEDSIMFGATLPNGSEETVATTGGLRRELEALNDLAWQADEKEILDWSRKEGYPVDGEIGSDGGFVISDDSEHTEYDTQSLAKFSFSVFYQALLFSEKNRVPILLDY